MSRLILYIVSFFCIINSISSGAKNIDVGRILVSDTILAPWTPMQVRRSNNQLVIMCWGREYIFEHSILPSKISSNGVNLLTAPIEIKRSCNAQEIRWIETSLKVKTSNESEVVLEGNSTATDSCGEIEVKSEIHIEYDGLMMISLSFEYSKADLREPVSIEIPYKNSIAKYYMQWASSPHDKYSGGIPTGQGILMESNYTPYYWIGDNDRGLFWFCEGGQDWPNAQSKTAIQFIRKEGKLIQKLNLGSPDNYIFGLQATPVKPLPDHWRKWRIFPAPNSTIIIPWPNPDRSGSVKYFGLPKAQNEVIYKRMIKRYHAEGKKVLAYAAITRIPSLSPFYQRNKSKWKKGKTVMKLKWDNLVYIDPASPGYRDSIAHLLTYYMEKYGLDGYYLDGAKMYPYWQNKKDGDYYSILEYRALQKTLYDSLKVANPNSMIIAHMSSSLNIPVLAYVDAYVDGEQFRYGNKGKLVYKVQESYLDIISLEQFRAEFMGRQWGLIPFFLPEISPNNKKTLQPTMGLAALLLLHDVQPWPTNSNVAVWDTMYQALDTFGFEKSSFIPYFDSIPPAITNLKDVYVSAYKKDNGQILIIVSNLSKERKQGIVTLNLSRMGIKGVNSIYSLPGGDKINYNNDKFNLSIMPLTYQLFWIK